jgi:hypothetical protein
MTAGKNHPNPIIVTETGHEALVRFAVVGVCAVSQFGVWSGMGGFLARRAGGQSKDALR